MKQVTLTISDTKFPFFMELISNLNFIKVEEENSEELPQWQKDIIDQRLDDYNKNPNDVMDFDQMMDDLEKKYL